MGQHRLAAAVIGMLCITGCSHLRHPPGAPPTATAAQPAPAARPVNVSLVQMGYSVHKRGAQTVYCRSERPTGSSIRATVCLTEAELAREASTTRSVINNVSDPAMRCNLAGCRRR
jgi:hypothetical protein